MLQTNGNIDHSIFRKLEHTILAPTENLYSCFNAGDNMVKVICLVYSFGEVYSHLYLISDIIYATTKTLNLTSIMDQC